MKIVKTVIFGSGALMCGNAGFWQLRRKKWKESLIEDRKSRIYGEPVTLTLPLQEEVEYTPVKAEGIFQHDKEMLILKKNGGRNGYFIITPLQTESSQSILVNRGWIPIDLKLLSSRSETSNPTSVVGVLRKSSDPGKFTPENDSAIGEWYYINTQEMSDYRNIDYSQAKGFYLQSINYGRSRELLGEEDLPEIPVRTAPVELLQWTITPVTHLSYAMFWFGTSLICLYFGIRR